MRQGREWGAAALEWESLAVFMTESVNRLAEVERLAGQGAFNLEDGDSAVELSGAVEAIAQLNERLASIFGRFDEEQIQWIDLVRRNLTLHSTPLSVGPILSEQLFQQKDAVALTSATLATDANFQFLRQRVGFPEDSDELLVDSPFNYRRNTLLLVPDDYARPASPGGRPRSGIRPSVILNMAQALDGHLLALFTSHSALREASFQVRGTAAGRRA